MDRAGGALLIVAGLFGIWAWKTGRLDAVKAAINAPGSAAATGSAQPLATVNKQAACHNLLSASCASEISKVAGTLSGIAGAIGL